MSKDRIERRAYRKSPGRQYGYDYDPLRSHGEQGQDGPGERGSSSRGTTSSRPGALLTQRPDPRRTRQLMRQSIISSKSRALEEETEPVEPPMITERPSQRLPAYEEPTEGREHREYKRRGPARSGRLAQPHLPSTRELMDDEDEALDEWPDLDPNAEYDDELLERQRYPVDGPGYAPEIEIQPPVLRSRRGGQRIPSPARERPSIRPHDDYDDDYDEDEDYEYEYEDDAPPARRKARKRKLSRRGLLFAAGGAAAIGIGVAAYENAPKIPQAIGQVGSNVEQQIQDAFNRGVAQGADAARKEIITALENLEGFTLDGAIAAAKLTRVAYDVFVSPVIKFGATLTGDFLSAMLKAFRTARGWLAQVYQDNATLIAIQKVLESWVDQVSNMPKQLDAITQTDLDGAQAYLRALQRKIDEEKAKLNGQQATPTPAPDSKKTPKATPKPTQKTS